MSAYIKTWQERMPGPWLEKWCDMNCSPKPRDLADCSDCIDVRMFGDPVKARDEEIADLRAELARRPAVVSEGQAVAGWKRADEAGRKGGWAWDAAWLMDIREELDAVGCDVAMESIDSLLIILSRPAAPAPEALTAVPTSLTLIEATRADIIDFLRASNDADPANRVEEFRLSGLLGGKG